MTQRNHFVVHWENARKRTVTQRNQPAPALYQRVWLYTLAQLVEANPVLALDKQCMTDGSYESYPAPIHDPTRAPNTLWNESFSTLNSTISSMASRFFPNDARIGSGATSMNEVGAFIGSLTGWEPDAVRTREEYVRERYALTIKIMRQWLNNSTVDDAYRTALANCALSQFSVQFGFSGNWEEECALDALLNDTQREELARLASHAMPAWWSMDIENLDLFYHQPAVATHGYVQQRNGERILRDSSWEVLSQGELSASYVSFDVGEQFKGTPVHQRTCTWSFFGDDAGDYPLTSLKRGPIGCNAQRKLVISIRSAQQWARLVEAYPLRVAVGPTWVPEGYDPGVFYTLDWERLGEFVGGVYMSVAGALETLFVPISLPPPHIFDDERSSGSSKKLHCAVLPQGAWTMCVGFTPGSVVWIGDEGWA
ncbi:hypothetical protein [Actinotignum urinale]|uniref:hypothetical protein n=1 Tax=Actinotignum urinale TaxID=190146 RepID=UPI002A813DD4|nr:hypothetical protein [Actinotignum urinale]